MASASAPLCAAVTRAPGVEERRVLAVGCVDGRTRVYACDFTNEGAVTFEACGVLDGHADWVRGVAFAPTRRDDAVFLATASQDRTARGVARANRARGRRAGVEGRRAVRASRRAAGATERGARRPAREDVARELAHRTRGLGHVRGVAPGRVEDGFDDGEHGSLARALVSGGRAVDERRGWQRALDELDVLGRGGGGVLGVLRRVVFARRRRDNGQQSRAAPYTSGCATTMGRGARFRERLDTRCA